jgi:hypothetical protein
MDSGTAALNEWKFNQLISKQKSVAGGMEMFQKDPLKFLRDWHIDLLNQEDITGKYRDLLPVPGGYAGIEDSASTADPEKISADVRWWGVQIYLNDTLCKDLEIGSAATAVVGPIIAGALGGLGILTGGAATIVGGVLAAAFTLKAAEIAIMNNGNGVYIPITWLQWTPILAVVPGTPMSLAMAAAIVHPIRA